jgi:unsaturated rhamnogalacturonyl hydrolase
MYLRPIEKITPNGEAVGVNWTRKMICLALATTCISPAAILAATTQADVPLKSPIRRTNVSGCRNEIRRLIATRLIRLNFRSMAILAMLGLSALNLLPKAYGQTSAPAKQWSQRVADSAIARWPAGNLSKDGAAPVWQYEEGTLLEGMDAVWYGSASKAYFSYIKQAVDNLIATDGTIPSYRIEEHSLDQVLMGRQLLLLYRVTLDKKYYEAAKLLRKQLAEQPRTHAGGFWHKQRYPEQMWLDGLYMAEPFYAEYAKTFQEPEDFDDIAKQFSVIEEHARDPKTGLLYHAWDESHEQQWSDKQTGLSKIFWARGIGWYAMALTDTIGDLPQGSAGRAQLIGILNRLAAAIQRYQDPKTGLWYEVVDRPQEKDNYLESSASCMFVYALDKGVRLGYLPVSYQAVAKRGYDGILSHFVQQNPDGSYSVTRIVKGIGLGGEPYRDGSYDYYVHSDVVTDDPKGVGAFLLASSEAEMANTALLGRGNTVLIDAWFNSQKRQNALGQTEIFHYKWDDLANSGFSFFAHIFRSYGVKTDTLDEAPTLKTLSRAQIYIIASPDIPSKNPAPNYVNSTDVEQVADWVRQGGVLVLMENDAANAEFDHFNHLSEPFGIHFNAVIKNQVPGSEFEKGAVPAPADGKLFLVPHKFYMKEICTITASAPARPVLTLKGDTVMAVAKYGRGTVYAVVDPWLYNEYTDGRRLPMEYDNYAGGKELVRWLIEQVPPRH